MGTSTRWSQQRHRFAEAEDAARLYGQQTAGVWKRLVPDEDQTSDELTVTDPVAVWPGYRPGRR